MFLQKGVEIGNIQSHEKLKKKYKVLDRDVRLLIKFEKKSSESDT